jgi:hypothetical protein
MKLNVSWGTERLLASEEQSLLRGGSFSVDMIYIVAYLLHAITVGPQKQAFINNTRKQQWNNEVMQTTSGQRLGKHTSAQEQWRRIPTVFITWLVFSV